MKLFIKDPAAARAYETSGQLSADIIGVEKVTAAFSMFSTGGGSYSDDPFLASNFDATSPTVHRLRSYFPDSPITIRGRQYYKIGSITANMPEGKIRRVTGQFKGVSASLASNGFWVAMLGAQEVPTFDADYPGDYKIGPGGRVQMHFVPEVGGLRSLDIYMSGNLPGGPIPIGGPVAVASYDSLWLVE